MAINIIAYKNRTINKYLYSPTLKDAQLVENLSVRKINKNKMVNLKRITVLKPWGAEYLCGCNKNFEIWELYIKQQQSTSLHCHPEKDTLNIVIEGSATLETIRNKEILHAGDFKIIKAGVVHKTINYHEKSPIRILEIESPPNKYNLIRIKDNYGRESAGYTLLCPKKNLNIEKHHCLLSKKGDKRKTFYTIYKFIGKKRGGIAINELFIHSLNFKTEKGGMLKRLKTINAFNLFVVEGSLSLYNKKFFKLLPGDCMANFPLWKFNWSTTNVKLIIW